MIITVRDGMGLKFMEVKTSWSTISIHAKFHPNRINNRDVENFHFWSILVGRAGRAKNGCSYFKDSIAVWKVINDLCTEFELNRIKIDRVSPF